MIADGEEWYYLAVKSLPALFRRIISNHNGDLKNMKNYVMNMITVM